ncbi:TrgA family protein [Shimia thalassica]|uniref:TrgA family protein n=1 Tax=Shimia thalassica TaxID=1715693 RepID=UPI00273708FE|nr:TrgA family protein [Shimia thalassica]MDP2581321.1 TrgA family protein [Shimia thalassica]
MPTTNRLAAAICLAILGAVIAELVKPLMPEGTGFGHFTLTSAGIGVVVGWFILGPRVGGTYVNAINSGITSVVILVVVGLFTFGANEMLRQALRHRFDDPMVAIKSILEEAIDYAQYLLDVKVIATLVVGAIVSGIVTEFSYRRWR